MVAPYCGGVRVGVMVVGVVVGVVGEGSAAELTGTESSREPGDYIKNIGEYTGIRSPHGILKNLTAGQRAPASSGLRAKRPVLGSR